MICGLVLKYLNISGLVMIGRYETTLPCTSQFPLTLPKGVLKGHDVENQALFWLHDFRSTYTHYPPVQLTLEASEVRSIVRIAVNIIDLEIKKGDWERRPLITIDEVKPVLDGIQRRFEDFEES